MKSLFQSTEDQESMRTWYARFRGQLPEPLESRRVQTPFGETHLLVGGPVDGEPLVLLHGALASSAHALRELAPLLERFLPRSLILWGLAKYYRI